MKKNSAKQDPEPAPADQNPVPAPADPLPQASELQAAELQAAELMEQAGRLLVKLEHQVGLLSNPVDGTCPVFYEDEVFQIALPWAAFDNYQLKIATRHTVPDAGLFVQLFDLLPDLNGRTLLDVGSYTGLSALVMQRFLGPSKLHLVEPQKVMQEALQRTVKANLKTSQFTLHDCIIDNGDSAMTRASSRPDRLSEASYLRREGGKLQSSTIDSLGIRKLGLIHLDMPGQKIYALRGAEKTLTSERPVIVTNLTGRDIAEQREFLEGLGYEYVRAGKHSAIFLPK